MTLQEQAEKIKGLQELRDAARLELHTHEMELRQGGPTSNPKALIRSQELEPIVASLDQKLRDSTRALDVQLVNAIISLDEESYERLFRAVGISIEGYSGNTKAEKVETFLRDMRTQKLDGVLNKLIRLLDKWRSVS